jgi:hypothetical protein
MTIREGRSGDARGNKKRRKGRKRRKIRHRAVLGGSVRVVGDSPVQTSTGHKERTAGDFKARAADSSEGAQKWVIVDFFSLG